MSNLDSELEKIGQELIRKSANITKNLYSDINNARLNFLSTTNMLKSEANISLNNIRQENRANLDMNKIENYKLVSRLVHKYFTNNELDIELTINHLYDLFVLKTDRQEIYDFILSMISDLNDLDKEMAGLLTDELISFQAHLNG